MGTDGWTKYGDCDDPSWVEASEPFLIFFADPRPFTWDDILDWAEAHEVNQYWCRQIIAYLELKSLIWADIDCEPVLWQKCGDWTVRQARKNLRNGVEMGFEMRERIKREGVPVTSGGDFVMGNTKAG